MKEESELEIPSVSNENLRLLSLRGSVISERRICELSELADSYAIIAAELVDRGLGILEILSYITDELSFAEAEIHDGAMEENRKRLCVLGKASEAADRVIFAELLTKRLVSFGLDISENSFLPEDDAGEFFVYVKNAYSDEAYDVFSQDFQDPRLKYCKSFKDAVAAVLSGDASYALLPLEEAGGTRLPTVAELIYRNDLKISAVTPVFGPDGAAELKYALVSEKIRPFPVNADDDRYLEIRLSKDADSELSGIILAADMYGAQIYRINTLNFISDETQSNFFSIVLRAGSCDFTNLLVYLTLFTDDFTPVGLYKNLE